LTAPVTDTCATCHYMRDRECRRRAPVLIGARRQAHFPVIDEAGWCGDHETSEMVRARRVCVDEDYRKGKT
jgi:hypothetical protein